MVERHSVLLKRTCKDIFFVLEAREFIHVRLHNVETFVNMLNNAGVSLSSFLALHNLWLGLTDEEKEKLIDEKKYF